MNRKSIMCGAGVIAVAILMPARGEGLTLEQVIREVCTKSDSVKMMQETVKKSEEMVREKWSNALPVISANAAIAESHGSLFSSSGSSSSSRSVASAASEQNASAANNHGSPYVTQDQLKQTLASLFSSFSEAQNSTIYNTGLSISQPIYTFGKVGTAIQVARKFDESTKYSYQRSMQALQLQAFDAFFRTVLANKAGDIAERSLVRKKELHGFLDRNFNLGSGSKAQVLATKADVANQSTAAIVARRDAYTTRMYINMFMGRSVTDSVLLDTTTGLAGLLNVALPSADEAVKTALNQRTDLKSIKLLAESNMGGAKIYNAMYLPSIGAQGSLGYSKMESGSKIVNIPWMGSWTVGLGVNWTLFDGFANNAKARQYISDAHKLEIVYNTMSNMVEIEIRTALAECAAADSNFAASKDMFSAAQESYDLTNSNFKQGSGQFADLQLAEELLMQAEMGLTNAKYRLLRSRTALQVAMGNSIISMK